MIKAIELEEAINDAIETYCTDDETTKKIKIYFGDTKVVEMIEKNQEFLNEIANDES